jgi:antitoxin (DNA-binding transcriptional repressor) of toxin-antitoxin stability system
MGSLHPMTHRIPIADARKHLASVIRRCAAGARFKITRYDRTLAVLVPARDLQVLEDCEPKERPPGPASARAAAGD